MSSSISNILATVFFGLAFLWFVIAVSYACSVVLFLRMRREGRFQNVSMNDPEFGRFYLCGDRCYLPMGWIFRRFILQYQNEQERRSNKGRVISKSERREAMATLLSDMKLEKEVNTLSDTSSSSGSDTDEEQGCGEGGLPASSSDVENVCSICLGHYATEASAWKSHVCKHRFHRVCLLEWLQQPGKTECPCCRESFVDEDDVWNMVKKLRRKGAKTSKAKRGTAVDDTGDVSDEEVAASDEGEE
mmetsp:Transcript_8669/g.16520  ORF Transcript_8669/g.16520 Transcript_8669/m.16520 type:complete len:246 (-) Transcript_8669:94-831(-)|eukprot:scaffold14763_cov137-Amphora_coffeaeformis.AAC.6